VVTATQSPPFQSVTVAVVCICSAEHLAKCLRALGEQADAPPFDVVVASDPRIDLPDRWPGVRVVSNEGQRTPLELASRAVAESTGDVVLLTEDHCIPDPGWVRGLLDAQRDGRGAVGGRVELAGAASATDWAFYFVDFFRYAAPVREGAAVSLTVCNVSYRRDHLEQIADLWREQFHETAVNDALQRQLGPLWMAPGASVRMSRHVTLREAVRERYAFGRLFGCTRLQFSSPWRRAYYTALAPTLPLLLTARMARKAMRSRQLAAGFIRSALPLLLMVTAWSLGEWLGYLTRRLPRRLEVAPELPRR